MEMINIEIDPRLVIQNYYSLELSLTYGDTVVHQVDDVASKRNPDERQNEDKDPFFKVAKTSDSFFIVHIEA